MKKIIYSLTLAAALCGMQANAANNFTAANVEGKPGDVVNIELKLASDGAVAGYQVNLAADKAGLELGTATITGATALEGAWIGSNAVSTTSYNVLCYSETCKTYASNAAKVVAVIPVTIPADATAGTVYTFTLGKGVVSDATGVAATCANGTFTVTVKSAGVKGDVNGDTVFDILDVLDAFDKVGTSVDISKYNYNGDSVFDILDILAMFEDLK